MERSVDNFFRFGGDWAKAFDSGFAKDKDWKEQLRLVVLHLDWLLMNGWDLPDGVDLSYMREQAFSD